MHPCKFVKPPTPKKPKTKKIPSFLEQSESLILTIKELGSRSAKGVALTCVGEEAFIESSQELILSSPLISMLLTRFFLEMVMHPLGAAGGFCAAIVKIEEGFDMAIAIVTVIPDFGSSTTFCFVIFVLLFNNKLTAKAKKKKKKKHNPNLKF